MIGRVCKHGDMLSLPVLIDREAWPQNRWHSFFGRFHVCVSFCDVPGGDGGEATPVTIPNTEVKLFSADGTVREAARESRTLPGTLHKKPRLSKTDGAFLFLPTGLRKCRGSPPVHRTIGPPPAFFAAAEVWHGIFRPLLCSAVQCRTAFTDVPASPGPTVS